MFYYNTDGEYIFRYKVEIDLEKIKQLREEIISKCSVVEHRNYESINVPKTEDFKYIKNYKQTKIGEKPAIDIYSEDQDIYSFDYDYYNYPVLVLLIDKLLLGDTTVIDDIKNPKEFDVEDIDFVISEYKNMIKELNEENDIFITVNKLNSKLKRLETYKQNKPLNKDRISVKKYYPKVFECIKLQLDYKIKLDLYLEMQNKIEILGDDNLKKVLKLNKGTIK